MRRWCLVACLLLPTAAVAHGVRVTVTNGPAVIVTVTYEDGSPVAATPWVVSAPGTSTPYQSGHTDPAGRVVFLPDRPGEWQVRVTSTDGHGTGTVVTVTADMIAATVDGSGLGSGSKLIIGIAFLLLVFWLATRFLARRS